MKPNYELKAEILENCPEAVTACKGLLSYNWYSTWGNDEQLAEKYEADADFACALAEHMPAYFDEAMKMANADKARHKRLRKRLEAMFERGNVVFLTLTFTDEVLQNTSYLYRRQNLVCPFLKSISSEYVGNIDFGKKNGREHYHAVLLTDTDDFSGWTYGFYKAEKVRKEGVDALRVAKYISKLTNHAIKETTKRNALIYSR